MTRFSIKVCLVAAVMLGALAETSRAENVSLNYTKIKFDFVPQNDKGGITFGGDSTFPPPARRLLRPWFLAVRRHFQHAEGKA